MDNLSHTRNPNRSTSSLPKKPCNGNNGFSYSSGKPANTATTYDDVFGGPPRFGAPTLSPRLEDYCEIFSGFNNSRAAVSSIPVLDLPIVDDRDVYFDVRSQGFDYSEVFGGFNDLDLAPSYEELFMQRRSTVADCDSSDDAWTPEEVESFSGGGTEHSGKSPSFSNGRDSYDSIDGCTEFNISYNKASQISDTNISSGVIRVADLDAIPGYTLAVDSGRTKLKKETGPSSVGRGAFEDKDGVKNHYSSEPFVTVSQIGLKTHPTGIPPPSRPPPVLNSEFRRSASNSRTTGSEGSAEGSSPPFFDVEVDKSSAAVREAMVKAEAKLKSAREVLERKRDGARVTMKRTSMNNRTTEEGKSSHTTGFPGLDNNVDKHGSKSLSSQGSANSDGNDEFVELVRTERPRNADENSGGEDVSFPLNAGFFDQKLTQAASVDWEKQQRRAKGGRVDHEAKKLLKHPGTGKISSRHKRHEDMLAEKAREEPKNEMLTDVELQFEIGNSLPGHGGIVKHRNLLRPEENKPLTEKLAKQKKEWHFEEETKGIQNQQINRVAHQKVAEKNLDSVFHWEQNARKLREALGLADNESTLEVSLENGKKLGMRGETDETKLNEALRRMEEETRLKEARVKEETDRREREASEKAENEKKLQAALEQEEKVKKLKEAREKEENERRVAAYEKAEQERRMKEQEEYELRLKEAFEREERNRRMREAREKAENERKMKEALEKEENDRRRKEAHEKAELEQRLKETREQEENERRMKEVQEREENERRAKEVLEQKEIERKVKEAHEKEELEKKLKEAIELEEKEKRLIEAFERAETERRLKEELELEEMGMKLQEANEREERERAHRDEYEMEKTCEATNEAHGEQWLKESPSDTLEEDGKGESHESVNKVHNEEEEDGPCQRVSMSEEACPWKVFEKNLKDASQEEGTSEMNTESTVFEMNQEEPQLSENGGYNQRNGVSGEKSASVTDNVQGGKLNEKSKKFETTIDPSELKGVGGMKTEVAERSEDENVTNAGVGSDQRNPVESKCANKTSSGFVTQAALNQDAKSERPLPSRVSLQREKEAERLKRERDSETERLRKIEEEREREREREKDRMAFDQRALADARERLEKACAEARERSLPDKISIEARLRAERAAVERATTEARERAAEKAAFEARERMERSVSDKQFKSSGFFGEQSVSDKQFQSSVSFGASRYQNSDGESPQRYTSRLERHRRTADRVAKALAEKNMRDLVAQREQAERIRIAETLDAEVKRWSSGKEGNIRALLSTLQYILGAESGWQPLPLTEVITSAAVKRAYRKATLCVHPDKLQQRGANIHQKYICEKVFDLLKEAWNRFNSEER